MPFKCQEDSFLKEFTSKVISCEESEFLLKDSEKIKGFNVILEDTVLFPEGGGQPCDLGFINGLRVRNVIRKGSEAVHFIESEKPLEVGQEVKEIVDWDRRLDHMQQHSGQHLITAIFERDFGYDTKCWWLGTETSFIELDAKNLTQDDLNSVEKTVNQLIADAAGVSVKVYDKDDPALSSGDVTRATRGLPEDHVGSIRVVTIEGVESNMCCGTHVNNLSQLQCIKILNIEKSKGKLLLHFLVGNRVLKKLQACFNRELEFTTVLKGSADSHLMLLTKLQSNLKKNQRTLLKCLKELAVLEADRLNKINPVPKYFFLHRSDGADNLEFITNFLRNVKVPEVFLFLTNGDDSGKGQLVLQGNEEIIQKLRQQICTILDGKGNGNKQRFNAKVNNLKKIPDCEKLIAQYFDE